MVSINRRRWLTGAAGAGLAAVAGVRASLAEDTPGVTATEIRIGSTTSLSGPVSALGQARLHVRRGEGRQTPDRRLAALAIGCLQIFEIG